MLERLLLVWLGVSLLNIVLGLLADYESLYGPIPGRRADIGSLILVFFPGVQVVVLAALLLMYLDGEIKVRKDLGNYLPKLRS